MRARKAPFFFPDFVREKERREESFQGFSPRSMEFYWSIFVGPRTKVHLIDKRYTWVPKIKDFDEDPKEEIRGKSKLSSLGGFLPIHPRSKR